MSFKLKLFINKHLSVLMLLLTLIIISIFLHSKSPHFFQVQNIINILEAASYKLILAVGMTFIIASRGIDLSIGSIAALSGITMATAIKSGLSPLAAIVLGLLAGILMGSANGILAAKSRVNPLIITLATASIFRGISLVVTEGVPISRLGADFIALGNGAFLNTKIGVLLAVIVILIAFPLMNNTRWGHYIKSMGGNEQSLKRLGVNTAFYRISSYAMMGFLSALAALIVTARLNSAEPNALLGIEFDTITAVILGGTPLNGGKASVTGTVLAVFLLSLIRNGLTILSITPFYQQLITGAILLAAVLITSIRQQNKA